ncbi:MAG: methyltransferase domain-containing protein [Chloroflexi bacterium]|uniref:Acetylserotonin O-methyltransferase n=1 Tax=Candidatus Chlorohelix allophototropha TaxID=3003348 RepID=A0A8T7M4H5_9CHLR|nr:methyltransferase domain-containing protein [Chloroflexota bacterium]WJW70010.1 acetylserotonin O-methyltransferase [Chloroflexota bacterium L227-S17]
MSEYRERIQEMLNGYRITQTLITCVELGIFEQLKNERASVSELGQSLNVDIAALTRLLNSATALGLVERDGQYYHASPLACACLVPEGSHYMGKQVKREAAFYRRWSHLTEAVRTGQRPTENTTDEKDPNWVRNFELALLETARINGPLVAKVLEPLLPQRVEPPLRVIDVGGGHGGYSIALAEYFKGLQAVVFELPAAAEVAREVIATANREKQVSVQSGDFRVDSLGDNFDLVLLFGVLASETAVTARNLLAEVYRALVPGGIVAIRGFYLKPDGSGTVETTLIDLHLLLSSDSGKAHSVEEMIAWLQEAGFQQPTTLALPGQERDSLLVAQK